MNRNDFALWVREKPRLLDGATGTNLMAAGMTRGVCPEKWISENPDAILRLQRAYAEAGSDILYAPTFGANRVRLKGYGLESEQRELCLRLVSLTREASAGRTLVAGNISSIGEYAGEGGRYSYEDLVGIYREQASFLLEAGVDLIAAETLMGKTEACAAAEAVRSLSAGIPVLCTLTLRENGKGYFDGTGAEAAEALEELGCDAVGINCSSGPEKMIPLIRDMRTATSLPLVAKPNAGQPAAVNGELVYSMTEREFAGYMSEMLDSGASLIGGCCGTTPAFIRALREMLDRR